MKSWNQRPQKLKYLHSHLSFTESQGKCNSRFIETEKV